MIARNNRPLRQFFEDCYRPRRLLGGSASTTRHYRILFAHFHNCLEREPMLTDLEEDTVCRFLAWLAARQSAVTANKYIEKLSAVWRYANRRGEVSTWPELPKLRQPRRVPEAWSLDQVGVLLSTCRLQTGQVAGVPAEGWWFALCVTLYYTGVRIGALLALRFSDVNFAAGTVTFRAETQKNFSDQKFSLPHLVLESLAAIEFPQRELVFPWPRSPNLLWGYYEKILDQAKLPNDRRSKFHRLRRTSASHLAAAGGNATQHLGHSGPGVTKAYLDPEILGDSKQCFLLPPPLPPEPPAAAAG